MKKRSMIANYASVLRTFFRGSVGGEMGVFGRQLSG